VFSALCARKFHDLTINVQLSFRTYTTAPAYRIRVAVDETAELRNGTKVSKDVAKTRKYERALLGYYSSLVDYIVSAVAGSPKTPRFDLSSTAAVAMHCACVLLRRCFDFNRRKDIVRAVVPLLAHPSTGVRGLALPAVTFLLRNDEAGDASLEAVRLCSGIVQKRFTRGKRGPRVTDELLRVFLALPLDRDIILAPIEEEKKKQKKRRADKKKKAEAAAAAEQLAKDLAESEARVSIVQRKKVQTAMLTEVMTTYFRILKKQTLSTLLPVVLEGLSKFAMLVNVDLVLDLLQCLKKLLDPDARHDGGDDDDSDDDVDAGTQNGTLSLESMLHCLLTVFTTLKTRAEGVITIDVKEFYARTYALLWRLALPAHHRLVPLLLRCLQLMLFDTVGGARVVLL
jgi:nucleolar complex protein 3